MSFIFLVRGERMVYEQTYVGPIPPLVTTKSYFEDMRRVASTISSSSSAITSIRLRDMPSSKQYFAKKAEFVSTVLG